MYMYSVHLGILVNNRAFLRGFFRKFKYYEQRCRYRGVRGDGAEKYWDSSKSNMYYLEGNHWDICYNCPGCS